MANILPVEKKLQVVRALVEGMSLRAINRLTGVHRTTIQRILVEMGERCADLLDEMVCDVTARYVEVDEIWSFVGKKQRRLTEDERRTRPDLGDQYTFVAIDADTKLVLSHRVGKRDGWNALLFMRDLAERVTGRVQITSDGFDAYPGAVEDAFGLDVDYAIQIKHYSTEHAGRGRYAPPKVSRMEKIPMLGMPDESRISTSYVERQNLTMRMQMRRFTRLTNAFSKKREHLRAAVALHFAYYNFCRPHMSLGGITPAMAAGVTDTIWDINDLLEWQPVARVAA